MRTLHFITISRMRTERSLAASDVLSSGFSFVRPHPNLIYAVSQLFFVRSTACLQSSVRPARREIAVSSGGGVPPV